MKLDIIIWKKKHWYKSTRENLTEHLLTGFLVVKLKLLLWKFYGRHHDLVNRWWNIYVTNDHEYVLFVVITIWSFFIHDLSLGLEQE
jgi:hypothetical protein